MKKKLLNMPSQCYQNVDLYVSVSFCNMCNKNIHAVFGFSFVYSNVFAFHYNIQPDIKLRHHSKNRQLGMSEVNENVHVKMSSISLHVYTNQPK